METVIRSVAALPAADRSTLERLVGHALQNHEQLVIRVVSRPHPVVEPPTAAPLLPDWCDVYGGLPPERVDEIDRAIVRSTSSRNL